MPFSIAWCTLGLLLRNTVIWNNNYRCWKYCSNIARFPGSWVDWIGKKCYKIYHTLHLFSYDKTTMKECTAVYTCYFIIPTPLTFPHSLKLWHLTELLLYYQYLILKSLSLSALASPLRKLGCFAAIWWNEYMRHSTYENWSLGVSVSLVFSEFSSDGGRGMYSWNTMS